MIQSQNQTLPSLQNSSDYYNKLIKQKYSLFKPKALTLLSPTKFKAKQRQTHMSLRPMKENQPEIEEKIWLKIWTFNSSEAIS